MLLEATSPGYEWEPSVVRAFTEADWSFSQARSQRELHPYPARFIPEIPRQALGILNPQGVVIDPFCGSGTTLFEATRIGLNSVGIDLNPIACLIARVRCHRWLPGDAVIAKQHSEAIHEASLGAAEDTPLLVDIPRLDHWFTPWAASALVGATTYCQSIANPIWRDRIAVAISSVVVRLSRQDSDTRYAAVDKKGDQESAAKAIALAVLRASEWLEENNPGISAPVSQVWEHDATDLSFLPDDSASVAMFSPPYPNAYEYWLYHKYRMYWLGFDPIHVRTHEIGARPHYSKKNGLTADDFQNQLAQVFAELRRVLVPAAPLVVVIGDSVIGGQNIDNAEVTANAAETAGLDVITQVRRAIAVGKSSFNRAHSRGRREEHVILLRNHL